MEVPTLLESKNKRIMIVYGIFFLIVMTLTIFLGKDSININSVAGEGFIFYLLLSSRTEARNYKEVLPLILIVVVGIIAGAIILSSLSVSIIAAAIKGSISCALIKVFLEVIMPQQQTT